jgi:hypothetical protein
MPVQERSIIGLEQEIFGESEKETQIAGASELPNISHLKEDGGVMRVLRRGRLVPAVQIDPD